MLPCSSRVSSPCPTRRALFKMSDHERFSSQMKRSVRPVTFSEVQQEGGGCMRVADLSFEHVIDENVTIGSVSKRLSLDEHFSETETFPFVKVFT